MRVCHLVHHLANGGLEQQVYELVRHAGDEVEYTVCYLGKDDSLASDIRAAGGSVVDLEAGRFGPRSVFDPRTIREVSTFLGDEQFDLLHVHTPLYVHTIGRLAAALDGPDHVVGTYHNRRQNFHLAMRYLERFTRPLSSVNVGVSKAVERSFTGSATEYVSGRPPPRKSCTIYNGIEVEAFAGRVESADTESLRAKRDLGDELVFLNIGRYTPQKSQTDLIEGMASVVEHVPESHLFVVGWGQLEDDLRRSVAEYGLEDHVSITGKVPTVEEYYAAADVFVLSSIREGLPIVILEAMAAGLPIVATEVSGVPEAVVDGGTGTLVPPNAPDRLAEAMREMAVTDRREQLGKAGRDRVSDLFDVQRTSELYLSLYRSLVESE
jgi:glycosyltransferase involved in cell wall biosynthesis